jgi:hypothetical protein
VANAAATNAPRDCWRSYCNRRAYDNRKRSPEKVMFKLLTAWLLGVPIVMIALFHLFHH